MLSVDIFKKGVELAFLFARSLDCPGLPLSNLVSFFPKTLCFWRLVFTSKGLVFCAACFLCLRTLSAAPCFFWLFFFPILTYSWLLKFTRKDLKQHLFRKQYKKVNQYVCVANIIASDKNVKVSEVCDTGLTFIFISGSLSTIKIFLALLPLITTIVVFHLFNYPIKSLLLGIKCVFKHQHLNWLFSN